MTFDIIILGLRGCFSAHAPWIIRSHLQDVVQGLGAKGPARVEQSVARLVHLVLLAPWGLGVPRQRPLQGLAAALKLLAHVFEPANISGAKEGCERVSLASASCSH